jgi:hypothetical protein
MPSVVGIAAKGGMQCGFEEWAEQKGMRVWPE